MMMQSKPQTKGSTLRNGIRHDAVAREIPSATTVLFLDEFGMTLLYATLDVTVSTIRSGAFPIAQPD